MSLYYAEWCARKSPASLSFSLSLFKIKLEFAISMVVPSRNADLNGLTSLVYLRTGIAGGVGLQRREREKEKQKLNQ